MQGGAKILPTYVDTNYALSSNSKCWKGLDASGRGNFSVSGVVSRRAICLGLVSAHYFRLAHKLARHEGQPAIPF